MRNAFRRAMNVDVLDLSRVGTWNAVIGGFLDLELEILMRHDRAGWVMTSAISLLASTAAAQSEIGVDLWSEDRDWMASGLGPLVLLLGIGLVIALLAAAIAAIAIGVSRRRFGGPREA